MLGGCLSGSMYPLKADVLKKIRTKDDNTGQIKYTWVVSITISCAISPFVSTSFKAQPTNEVFTELYDKVQYLKMKTSVGLARDVRVTNIRNGVTGEVLYKEFELAGNPATNYNAMGSAALLDPFGAIIQYDTLLQRASDQSDANV
jgi:hypothetical protein